MKLSEAQRLARKLEQAEAEFDSSWSRRWRAIAVRGTLLLLPVSLGAGFLAQALAAPAGSDPSLLQAVFWGTWGASGAGLAALGPLLRRRAKRHQGMESMDAQVLQACASVEGIPPEVTPALESSLDAYLQISRLAGDPVWANSGISMREQVDHSGRHMLSLLDWGKRLGEVARTVGKLADRPEGGDVRAQYQSQVAQFRSAAAAFQALEAKVARAYVALSGAAPGQKVSREEMVSLGASFDALSEVLSASEAAAFPSEISRPQEEPATLRLGRG